MFAGSSLDPRLRVYDKIFQDLSEEEEGAEVEVASGVAGDLEVEEDAEGTVVVDTVAILHIEERNRLGLIITKGMCVHMY